MHRRKLLALSAVGVSLPIAGCAGTEDDGDDQRGDTDPGGDDGGDDDTEPSDDTGDDIDPSDDTGDGNGEPEAEEVEDVIGALVDGDNIHLVVESVRRETELGQFIEADDGNVFLVVSLAMKNVSDDFLGVSNLLQTSLRDDEDYTYSMTYAGGDEPTFNDGQFAPGEVERGSIVFEIPEDASGLELRFDFDVSIFGGVDRAYIDLESETDVHQLEQDLQIDIYGVGDTVEHGGVSVTVNDVELEEDLGGFTQPEEGHEYAIVDISVTNETGEEQYISTILQMLIKDEAGYSYQEDWSAAAQLDQNFEEGSPLDHGETRRGQVAYEVEQGASPIYWVFEFTLWNDGDKTFWELR